MKILHVITRSEWGGAQKIVWTLAKAQRAGGHQVTVMCGEQGRLAKELIREHIPVILNPYLRRNLSWQDVLAYNQLQKELKQGYDLLHAHSSKAGILGRLAGVLNGLPVCFTVHGFGVSPDHSFWKQLVYHSTERLWARWSAALVFVSESNRQKAEQKGWLRHAPYVSVIPNGIERGRAGVVGEATIPRLYKNARSLFGIPETAYVVGNLARLARIKNPEFWFLVAQEFLRHYPESYFIWFGGGESLSAFRERVKDAGLAQRVQFWGEVNDIETALEALDILFLSSHSEGMPLAVLEGMAHGLSILTPDLPELKELLGECGLTYPRGQVDKACDALRCLQAPDLRQSLGGNARQRCEKKYSVQQMVKKYEEVYHKLTGT